MSTLSEPVVGKTGKRIFAFVLRSKIHPCPLLPKRSYDKSVYESVKKDGQVLPVIVRRSKLSPDEYEYADGGNRLGAFSPNDKVLVEIVDLNDVDVFRISNATFNRTDRTPKERAEFFAAYSKTLEKQGCQNFQSKIAQDTGISESELSQLRSINHLFEKLAETNPETRYDNLERMGINKLYELSKLADYPSLIETASTIEKIEDISGEGIRQIVADILGSEKSDIEKALGEEDQGKSASKDAAPIPDLRAEFRVLHEKAMKTVEKTAAEMGKVLQYANYADPPTGLSIESKKYVEKINVGFRRINRYLRKLHEMLEPTVQDSNVS